MGARLPRSVRAWAVLIVLAPLLAGCVLWPTAPPDAPPATRPPGVGDSATRLPPDADWSGRNVTLAGRVVENGTRAPLANATVVVTLVSHPVRGGCAEDVLVAWASWSLDVSDDGRFGPLDVPEPTGGGLAYRVLAAGDDYREAILERAPSDPTLANLTLPLDPVGALAFDVPDGAIAAWVRDGGSARAIATATFPGGARVENVAAGRYHVVVATPGALPSAATIDVPAFGEARVAYVPLQADAPAPAQGVVTFANDTFAGIVVVALDDAGRPFGIAETGAGGAFRVHVGESARLVASAHFPPTGAHEGGRAFGEARAVSGDASVALTLRLPACRA